MKVAILANSKNSFVKPLAQGLARMTAACGETAEIHYDGLEILSLPVRMSWASPRTAASRAVRLTGNRRRFESLVARLRGVDVIVVVAHVPASVSRSSLENVEALRERLPNCPIVNYDLVYLPTVEKWGAAMLRGEEVGLGEADLRMFATGSFGMERYDWYLVASVASEIPMPSGPQPYSRIGIDLDDGSLFPDQQGEIRALVDFPQTRKNYPTFREVQLRALEQSGIPFQILEGSLDRDQIRAVYRKTGIFFLGHRESFGLPICELQACGSLIFTPHAEWAGAHWIKSDPTVAGPGRHSANFVVYQNDVNSLVELLQAARDSFSPDRVVKTFLHSHRQLFHGDREALSHFFGMVNEGKIHSRLNREHAGIGR
jgi:hypothetical protein